MWQIKISSTKTNKKSPRKRGTEICPGIEEIAARLTLRIAIAASRDPEIKRLASLMPKEIPKASTFSITSTWKADVQMGRSTSYYTLEEEALYADLPRVAAAHNRHVIQEAVEQRRREIAWETARDFWPLQTLSEEERFLVMYLAGVRPPIMAEDVAIPTNAAKKYKIVIRNGHHDGYDPDPEIEDLMAGSFVSENDLRKASLAEAGILQEGQKMNICFGSSGRS